MQQRAENKFTSEQAADLLIAAHDGDVALLYVYYTRRGTLDSEKAAQELFLTKADVLAAQEKLERMGLIAQRKAAPAPELEPRLEIPEYTAEEISRHAESDAVFGMLLEEAAKILGRVLSSSDIRILFGIYNYLGLPVEVIMELLGYCAELCRERYGEGRRPTTRAVEKEAYRWARREILTLEQAEDFIREQKERRSDLGRLTAALGIRDRALAPQEQKLMLSWFEMGFDVDAILLAYDRTVAGTGKYKPNYMNRVLLNWHGQGLHKVQEIEEKDSKGGKAAASVAKKPSGAIDMERLRKLAEQI